MQMAFFMVHNYTPPSLPLLNYFLHLIKSAAMQTSWREVPYVHSKERRQLISILCRLNVHSTILLMEFKYVFQRVCLFILIRDS